jgi:hypothetical protein
LSETRQFLASLVLGLGIFAAVHFLTFKGSVPHFVQVSNGEALFDTSIARSADDLHERLQRMGEAGRQEYVFRNLTTDLLLPLSLLPLLYLGTKRLRRRFSLGQAGKVLLFLPAAYVVFDLIENSLVVALILDFPERQATLASMLPVVTMIKRLAVFSSLLALLGGLTIALGARAARASLGPRRP